MIILDHMTLHTDSAKTLLATTLAQLTRILSVDLWKDWPLGQPFVRTLPAGSGCNSHIFTVASRLVNHTPTIHVSKTVRFGKTHGDGFDVSSSLPEAARKRR